MASKEWLLPLLRDAPRWQEVTSLDIKRNRPVTRRIYFEKGPFDIYVTDHPVIAYHLLPAGQFTSLPAKSRVDSIAEAAERLAMLIRKQGAAPYRLSLQAGIPDEARSGDEIVAVEYGGPILRVEYDSKAWNHFAEFAGIKSIELDLRVT